MLWLHWLTVPNTPASNYLTRKQHNFNQIYLQRMDVKCYIVGYRNNIITKMRPFSEITGFIKPLCLLTRENELLQFVSIVVENLIKGLFWWTLLINMFTKNLDVLDKDGLLRSMPFLLWWEIRRLVPDPANPPVRPGRGRGCRRGVGRCPVNFYRFRHR